MDEERQRRLKDAFICIAIRSGDQMACLKYDNPSGDCQVEDFRAARNKYMKRAYYARNKEKAAAYMKAYREAHREWINAKHREYNRTYYAEHKEKQKAQMREYSRTYYAAHREEILARRKERKEEWDGRKDNEPGA